MPEHRVLFYSPDDLSDAQRETLMAWYEKLRGLVADRKSRPFIKKLPQLQRHLSSSIECARQAIVDACESRRLQILSETADLISPLFTHRGDAVAVAKQFPAMIQLRQWLRGPFPAPTLDGLVEQAEHTGEICLRLLEDHCVWMFNRPSEPQAATDGGNATGSETSEEPLAK